MSSKSNEIPKLSLVAQFDDMCRFANSLICVDEEGLIQLIRKSEDNRLQWLSAQRELILMRNKVSKLEEENHSLHANLNHVRYAFAKEVQNREQILKQKNLLINQLNAIKEFVMKDPIDNQNEETREKVLSFFNSNRLDTVDEEMSSNESLLDIKYDESEENLMDESLQTLNANNNRSEMTVSLKSNECQQQTDKLSIETNGDNNEEVFDPNLQIDSPANRMNRMNRMNRTFSEPKPEVVSNISFVPLSKSSPLIKISKANSGNLSQIRGTSLLEERKHNLQEKKSFKSLYCGPCGKSIGFCGTCLCCTDCRAICHISCKDLLPLPCIPYRKPNGSRMALIADFAPQNTRPMIPALIIHCCNEIEKRGLEEEGLYRKCGSDKEMRELKEKILNSKSGIPMLSQYDVHVLCGVLKQFLRELDEPIVTRILWRDFSRAADQENPDDEKALIMQTIEELPNANKDSLAFIILHLQRIVQSPKTLMDISSIAKVFGPTIVGYSMIDLPMSQLLAENQKQIKVMEALLKTQEDFLNNIIMSAKTEQNYGSPDRRTSIGSRLFGNVKRGSVTPQTNSVKLKGNLSLKPLF